MLDIHLLSHLGLVVLYKNLQNIFRVVPHTVAWQQQPKRPGAGEPHKQLEQQAANRWPPHSRVDADAMALLVDPGRDGDHVRAGKNGQPHHIGLK